MQKTQFDVSAHKTEVLSLHQENIVITNDGCEATSYR